MRIHSLRRKDSWGQRRLCNIRSGAFQFQCNSNQVLTHQKASKSATYLSTLIHLVRLWTKLSREQHLLRLAFTQVQFSYLSIATTTPVFQDQNAYERSLLYLYYNVCVRRWPCEGNRKNRILDSWNHIGFLLTLRFCANPLSFVFYACENTDIQESRYVAEFERRAEYARERCPCRALPIKKHGGVEAFGDIGCEILSFYLVLEYRYYWLSYRLGLYLLTILKDWGKVCWRN